MGWVISALKMISTLSPTPRCSQDVLDLWPQLPGERGSTLAAFLWKLAPRACCCRRATFSNLMDWDNLQRAEIREHLEKRLLICSGKKPSHLGRQVSEPFSASTNKAKYFDCGDAATAAHHKHSQKHTAEHTSRLMDTQSACSLLPHSE